MKKLFKINAILLSSLLAGSIGVFAACGQSGDGGNSGGNNGGNSGNESSETLNAYQLSSTSYNFQEEYFYSAYNAASNADTSLQNGIDTFEDKNIVFKNLYYDELNYLLNQSGTYLILFGGSWCHNTRAAISYINEYAIEYGIDTVYTFDFRLDGATANTHIRESASTPELGGESNEKAQKAAADWNYLYGELIDNYLTNLNDWVEYKEDTSSALTWYDVDYVPETVAKVQVPFLFIYNKDNTTHYVPSYDDEGTAKHNQTGVEESASEAGKTYPIVYGFEEMVDRDDGGVYIKSSGVKTYITDEYTARLENVFKFVDDNDITINYYSDEDYLYEAFLAGNGRGHADKLFDVFTEGEQINIEVITYHQLQWLFQQEGSAIILIGGAWCANTTASIGLINDYAVANNVTVYMWDTRLDGKYPIDFWGYGRDRQFQIRSTNQEGSADEYGYGGAANPFAYLYVDLINTYLTNIQTVNNPTSNSFSDGSKVVSYTDNDGNTISAAKAQAPYLFSYNKDALDSDGYAAPILAWHEQMLEITESGKTSGIYIYQKDNYAAYSAGIESVIGAYATSVGTSLVQYSGDPRHTLID